MADIVTGVGAGIYEELVFRLILICVLMVLFQDLIGMSHQNAVVLSVLISAALFSAHHHVVWVDGRLGRAPFCWMEFGFRTIAGVYFAILFAIRGFGITAGTHAFYDIIATIVNAIFFAAVGPRACVFSRTPNQKNLDFPLLVWHCGVCGTIVP